MVSWLEIVYSFQANLKLFLNVLKGRVNCGGHDAGSCAGCPQGNGQAWCNGECQWIDGECESLGKVL